MNQACRSRPLLSFGTTEYKFCEKRTCRTQSRISVSQALERIRKVQNALPSNTRGGSRMRESRTYGSVRGALSNERPYRVCCFAQTSLLHLLTAAFV
jgi:hypothetical protein